MSTPSSHDHESEGPGRASTLRDVARMAGVSTAIASRVLNADPQVRAREETQERIRSAARALHYVPHSLARSLRGARAGAIGLVMHGLDSPINVDVLRGARSRCAESGYVTLLAESEELTQDDSQLEAFLARGRLDGVILHGGYGQEDRLLDAVCRSGAAVLVNTEADGDVPTVRVDDAAAASVATSHVMGLGHTAIHFVGGPAGSQTSDRREAGFRETMDHAGLGEGAAVVHAGWSAASGRDAAQSMLAGGALPTAVVVANAVTASGLLSEFRDAGLDVPADLSVIAIHDSWFLEHLSTPLTSVRLPLQALGAAAAQLLIDEIDAGRERAATGKDPQGSRDVFITDPPPQLVVRASTGPPRR